MIKTQELTKIFPTDTEDVLALDNLSIDIKKGSVVGLLGPNGAGKTTCVRLLATIYRPTSGNAEIGGYSIHQDPLKVRQIIGISPENPSLYDRLTGRRNLRFYGELYDVPKDELNDRIDVLAEEFDLDDAIDRPVGGYSRGMRQKVSIAKALLHSPDILFLDEPWAGLSPVAARDLRAQISHLQETEQRTILITTHNLAQTEKIADRIIIISHGKLIAQGSPQELRDKYNIQNHLRIKMKETKIMAADLQSHFDYIQEAELLDNGEIEITIDSFDHTPDVVEYLVSQKAKIFEVKEVIPSLEDLYLSLVEEG